MSHQGLWGAGVQVPEPQWMQVPRVSDDGALNSWVESSMAGLRELWGDEWKHDTDPDCVALLRDAVTRPHDGKLLNLLYWPLPGPAVMRIAIRVMDSVPVSHWVDDGFEVDGFDSADLGPGLRCVLRATVQVGEQDRTAITAHYVFDDGSNMVFVEIEPMPIELFTIGVVDILQMLNTMQIRRPDGQPFNSRPVAGYTVSEMDTFTGLTHGI